MSAATTQTAIERLHREEWGRIQATLIRVLGGDFDLAEDVAQEAFAAALEQWPESGTPANPRAWIIQTARHKAVDRLRRRASFEEKRRALVELAVSEAAPSDGDRDDDAPAAGSPMADDRLRLLFTCCHPALALEAQVALTLRTLCGLTTEEIARAFLLPAPTLAQRLVRAKHKIREARIPYQVPAAELLDERLAAVMTVVYLVFNEGYAATAGEALVRRELCTEAIRLGRLLETLLPAPAAEPTALVALMLLSDARRDARVTPDGDLVLLEDQDRTRWDAAQIAAGLERVERALRAGPPGPYALQAAIAGLHARAARAEDTDWPQIAALYALLVAIHPSPIVELNRAVAVAMADGPARGLLLLDALDAAGELAGYHLLHAARADLYRRLGRTGEAQASYRQALALTQNEPERRFLQRRLDQLA